MLKPGDTFAGYTIVCPLGAGGMGEVHLANHPRLPRTDALKIVGSAVSADPAYQQRFIREADLAAKLWHPNIVGVHDRGESEGQLWIAMDFVEGCNAEELLSSRYPAGMPYEDVVAIVTGVAEALDYAHKQGLVHRDIKPSNIMLADPDEDGRRRILLTDFGIARTVGEVSGLTATNMTVGTVAYCAPEQLIGAELDGRADQYALAATAYHLLTGSPVFPDSNPAVVIGRHLSLDPPAPSTIRPELAAIDSAFARALAKKPEDRFARCQDFARALASTSTTSGGSPIGISGTAPTQEAPVPAAEAAAAAAATQLAPVPSPESAATTRSAPIPSAAPHKPPPPPPGAGAAARTGSALPGWWKFAAAGIAVLLAIGVGVFFAARPQPTTTASNTPSSRATPSSTEVPPLQVALPPAVAESGVLRVVTNLPYTPAEFYDTQNQIVGFDVDLINAVADVLGIKAEFQNLDFNRLIPSVQQGTSDVAMAAITDTKTRQAVADLVNYYSAGTLWAQRADTPAVDPTNACGLTVAAQRTTIQETDELPALNKQCVANGKQGITILSFEGQDDAVNAVVLGQADAFSADSPVTGYAIKMTDGRLIQAGALRDTAPYGWAVAKGSLMGPALQQALQRVINSGRYRQILDRWGVDIGAITTARINGAAN